MPSENQPKNGTPRKRNASQVSLSSGIDVLHRLQLGIAGVETARSGA